MARYERHAGPGGLAHPRGRRSSPGTFPTKASLWLRCLQRIQKEITPIRVALEGLAVRMYVSQMDDSDLLILENLVADMEQAWREMDLASVRRSNYQFHAAIYSGSGSRDTTRPD